MATSFPGAVDAFTNPTSSDNLNSAGVLHADQHANANDAIEAIEAAMIGLDTLHLIEDFAVGGQTDNVIGTLGWRSVGGTTTTTHVAGEANHPGILRKATSATISSIGTISLKGRADMLFLSSTFFDVLWIVRLNTNDANTTVRIGIGGTDLNTQPPANGVYVEKLDADTSWFGVTRAASSQTRTAALAATSTGWIKVRVRRIDASTVGFTLDGGTEVTATATVPTLGATVFVSIQNSAAADKTIDLDYCRIVLTGMTR